jgi:hypothetical protein
MELCQRVSVVAAVVRRMLEMYIPVLRLHAVYQSRHKSCRLPTVGRGILNLHLGRVPSWLRLHSVRPQSGLLQVVVSQVLYREYKIPTVILYVIRVERWDDCNLPSDLPLKREQVSQSGCFRNEDVPKRRGRKMTWMCEMRLKHVNAGNG